MFKLQEYSYVEGFDRKPTITWEKLVEHKEGLLITSTCLASQFNQYILAGEVDKAKEWTRRAKSVFGEDFYIEIQPNHIPEQHICNNTALRIAKELSIELVATNDVHYVYEQDCFPHEVMLALQTKRKMSDEKRFKFSTNDFWLKSEEEMYATFEGLPVDVVRQAINNTSKIASKCNSRIEKGNYLPQYYDVKDGESERSILVQKTVEGVKQLGLHKNKSFMEEVQNEINVIDRNGYSGYFLVVQDYVNSARNKGIIVGDGRGSGAGSKVAYATGITKIPPHEYDLLFERFMADGRQPDFDVDFSDQDAVFEDLQGKYGVENVARIIAFGTMTPRACIRKVMQCFEHSETLIKSITSLVPDLCPSLEQAYIDAPQLLEYKIRYRTEWDVIERLEGVISHESQHAGGVIIYRDLSSFLPVKSNSEDRTKRIVAFDKYMLEELGHYKFDILGLETLPVIRRTVESIAESTGNQIDLGRINLEDEKVYDMLCSGDVSGVFQLAAQSTKVVEQQPRNFRDLIAINALIRPGVGDWNEYIARRKGAGWYKDPYRPWMHETLGTMTYQEQFLLDANRLAGWDIAYADKTIRKGKNLKENIQVMQRFIIDGVGNGYDEDYMREVWEQIVDAQGDYSFNKSHSASYAKLSYQTAWLKYYYPEHFYASLMSSEKTDGDGQNAIAGYIQECKQKGIKILPPDINLSASDYTVTNSGINYRITTIKHVGESAINSILNLRPIKSFDDFLERREKATIKLNVLVNLIKAGCFDFDNPNRAELLWRVDMANRTKKQIKEGYEIAKYEWNDTIKAEWEKEVLGMYLSIHPMERYGFKPLNDYKDGEKCIQGGQVAEIKTFNDRKGNPMSFVFIDTLYGRVKLLVFSSLWARETVRDILTLGNTILVKGRRSGSDVLFDEGELLT
jgi:DNA polymerase-3 subunit alpha